MRIGTLALVILPWALMAAPASAQPSDESDEDTYDDTAPGEPVANVDVFYDRLADDGTWADDPAIGHVFIPDRPNFVPYHNGHWKRTSVGFVWVSDEPFAWATTHYGRWAFSRPYSRWVWLPDTTWGPSWVDWRESGDHFGWAPLAPEIVIRAGYTTPIEYWHYAPGNRILDVNVVRYYEPRERIVTIHRIGTPIEHYARVSGARVVVGPPAVRLHAHGIVGAAYRPVKIETRLAGRMTAVESRAAVQRASERHDMIEQRNRARIEANPHIRDVHMKATVNVQTHDRPGYQQPHTPPAVHNPEPRPGYQQPHTPPAVHNEPRPEPRPGYQQPHTPPAVHNEPRPEPRPAYQQPHTPPAVHNEPRPEPRPAYQQPHTPPATHTAPPMTHSAPPATHSAPPPSHTTPARTAPAADPKKKPAH